MKCVVKSTCRCGGRMPGLGSWAGCLTSKVLVFPVGKMGITTVLTTKVCCDINEVNVHKELKIVPGA